ncbi:nitroreductase family protein [bacterium CPR1]|nr:nitroreductase family protein [bacterium CPR1]
MIRRALEIHQELSRRRTVRHFSDRPVPREIIEQCLLAASSAPSGANRQPWHFVVVTDPATRKELRAAAETGEREFYGGRAPREWLEALEPLGTDAHKPFLEDASCLIAIFAQTYSLAGEQNRAKNYYVTESVGIATGMLIAALHHCGLATLTHTPSPMSFLKTMLGRPPNERPFLLLVVGYPAEGCQVPDIDRKPLEQIATFVEDESAHRHVDARSSSGEKRA